MLLYQTLFFNKNNKFTISAPKWNKEFELLDGLYPVSDIED